MDWFDRWSHYCVTAVDGVELPAVLAGIGVDPVPSVEGTMPGCPLVRVLPSGSVQVLFEPGSTEGARPEVLRRLSASGRALSFASTGTGMLRLGYAEAGVVVASFEPVGMDDPAGAAQAGVAAIAGCWGIDVAELVTAELSGRGLAFALMAAGFGVRPDAALLEGPAVEGTILPVLPDLAGTATLPVRSARGAELSAVLQAAPPERVAAAVSVVAEQAAVTAGLAGNRLLDAGLREGTGVTNESDLGRLLRVVMAEGQVGTEVVSESERVLRRQAGRVLFTALSAAADNAVALMVATRSTVPVARLVLAELADVVVPASVHRAQEDTVTLQEGRSVRLDLNRPRVSGHGSGMPGRPGSRAVGLGELPPSIGGFEESQDPENEGQ